LKINEQILRNKIRLGKITSEIFNSFLMAAGVALHQEHKLDSARDSYLEKAKL
jgi:hypothetical protein